MVPYFKRKNEPLVGSLCCLSVCHHFSFKNTWTFHCTQHFEEANESHIVTEVVTNN